MDQADLKKLNEQLNIQTDQDQEMSILFNDDDTPTNKLLEEQKVGTSQTSNTHSIISMEATPDAIPEGGSNGDVMMTAEDKPNLDENTSSKHHSIEDISDDEDELALNTFNVNDTTEHKQAAIVGVLSDLSEDKMFRNYKELKETTMKLKEQAVSLDTLLGSYGTAIVFNNAQNKLNDENLEWIKAFSKVLHLYYIQNHITNNSLASSAQADSNMLMDFVVKQHSDKTSNKSSLLYLVLFLSLQSSVYSALVLAAVMRISSTELDHPDSTLKI